MHSERVDCALCCRYVSCSAFSPISNPSQSNWGRKAFGGYLGADEAAWQQYDSCALARAYAGRPVQLLVEQGECRAPLCEYSRINEYCCTSDAHACCTLAPLVRAREFY